VTSWERAERIKQEIADGKEPEPEKPEPVSLESALAAFMRDCEARNLSAGTLRNYRLLKSRLSEFAISCGCRLVIEFDASALRQFRESRRIGPRTAMKELERLRSLFRFFQDNEWISKNPARGMKPPRAKSVPRVPFSEDDIRKILSKAKDDRELAFVLCLRHTGLRIGDVTLLHQAHFLGDRILLRTTKTGAEVSVVIPPRLISLLASLKPVGGYFFLRGESTSMHTLTNLWREDVKEMCLAAGVTPPHPHRFRHSFAADLLIKGANVQDVADLLGNSPQIVEKHYSQFIKARQDRLDSVVAQTWQPTLVRVK
jgi:integrase